jgi:hypothetical protein
MPCRIDATGRRLMLMPTIAWHHRLKLDNVSNCGNYENVAEFVQRFEEWQPGMGIIHPHPVIGKLFHEVCAASLSHYHNRIYRAGV